jgi:hypothetical protein
MRCSVLHVAIRSRPHSIDPTDVTVDGARGIEFFSNAPRLNDTREVWFIHGGFLYEMTTYKELDTWLKPIMQSWQWI